VRILLMALRLAWIAIWTAIWAAILPGWPAVAMSAEPVRHIGIYVHPFYEAARTPDGRPQVAVGKQYNDLLGSSRREDIVAARDLILALGQEFRRSREHGSALPHMGTEAEGIGEDQDGGLRAGAQRQGELADQVGAFMMQVHRA